MVLLAYFMIGRTAVVTDILGDPTDDRLLRMNGHIRKWSDKQVSSVNAVAEAEDRNPTNFDAKYVVGNLKGINVPSSFKFILHNPKA